MKDEIIESIQQTEDIMRTYLLQASTMSENDPERKRLFSKNPTKVLELGK